MSIFTGADLNERFMQSSRLSTPKKGRMPDAAEVSKKIKESGKFVMLSTRRLEKSEVVPLYYKRMEIEQLFDVEKNYVKTLPLRIHSEETFRGTCSSPSSEPW